VSVDVSEMSKNLSSESKKYNWKAKQMSLLALYKQYAPFLILAILVVVVVVIRFVW
jgi:cell division septal protein FtsQ